MSEAIGWAVRSSAGAIKVETVSPTRRGAIVNYLVAEKQVMVFNSSTDEDIELMWKHYGAYCDCVTVRISA